jgi:hypothetical protein
MSGSEPSPVSFFFLIEKVKIQLRNLKLADIAVVVNARRQLDIIFHKDVLTNEMPRPQKTSWESAGPKPGATSGLYVGRLAQVEAEE